MNNLTIPLDKLHTMVGRKIHVAKLKYKFVFEIMAITQDQEGEHWMYLETPTYRKPYKFKAKYAQYLRKDIPNEN